jgi:hypothetical protein
VRPPTGLDVDVVEVVLHVRNIEEAVLQAEVECRRDRLADTGDDLPREARVGDGLIERAPTDLAIFELPDDGSGSVSAPVVVVAAANGSTWRPVPLSVEIGGEQTTARTARAATVMGIAVSTLAAGQSALLDLSNSVDVRLGDPREWLIPM